MRRLDLTPYRSHLDQVDADTGKPTGHKLEIQVQPSLVELLFAANPRDPLDFLKKAKFAERLEAHTQPTITVEEHEWEWLDAGLRAAHVKDRQFVELVRRVVEAEKVEVDHGH